MAIDFHVYDSWNITKQKKLKEIQRQFNKKIHFSYMVVVFFFWK
jgi:hypothetical protein